MEGTSDDLDRPIAALFRDTKFKHQHRLGSLNSVNVARVLMQAVHYFYAYFCAVDEAQTVSFGSTLNSAATGNLHAFSPSHSHIAPLSHRRRCSLLFRRALVATSQAASSHRRWACRFRCVQRPMRTTLSTVSLQKGISASPARLVLALADMCASVAPCLTFACHTITTQVVQTNSPSMDIQVPYNIERIFFLLCTRGTDEGYPPTRYMQSRADPTF